MLLEYSLRSINQGKISTPLLLNSPIHWDSESYSLTFPRVLIKPVDLERRHPRQRKRGRVKNLEPRGRKTLHFQNPWRCKEPRTTNYVCKNHKQLTHNPLKCVLGCTLTSWILSVLVSTSPTPPSLRVAGRGSRREPRVEQDNWSGSLRVPCGDYLKF